jgi:SulP family sulfate permease
MVGLIVGSILGVFIFTGADVVGTIPSGLPELQMPVLAADVLLRMIEPAVILAIIGTIETLLVALIADATTRTRHDPNRETIAQGIANIFSGLIGGLPGSGSPVATLVSIRAGGRTRVAGILVGLILFLFLFDLGKLAEQIPIAVLAALLIKIGWNVIDWRFLAAIHRIDKSHITVMASTAVLTVFVDILTAVAIGLIISGMINAMNAETLELDSVISVPLIDASHEDPFSARTGLVRLAGRFTVASATSLAHVIGEDIRDHDVVIFDFCKTEYMDDSSVMVIRQLVMSALEQGKPCIVMGLAEDLANNLHALDALKGVEDECFTDTLEEARKIADELLRIKDENASMEVGNA